MKSNLPIRLLAVLAIAAIIAGAAAIAINIIAAGENAQTLLRAQSCAAMNNQNNPQVFCSSCEGTYPWAACGLGADELSCSDGSADSTATFSNGKWAGYSITPFNSSIGTCDSII